MELLGGRSPYAMPGFSHYSVYTRTKFLKCSVATLFIQAEGNWFDCLQTTIHVQDEIMISSSLTYTALSQESIVMGHYINMLCYVHSTKWSMFNYITIIPRRGWGNLVFLLHDHDITH